jgi:hypothetical protein
LTACAKVEQMHVDAIAELALHHRRQRGSAHPNERPRWPSAGRAEEASPSASLHEADKSDPGQQCSGEIRAGSHGANEGSSNESAVNQPRLNRARSNPRSADQAGADQLSASQPGLAHHAASASASEAAWGELAPPDLTPLSAKAVQPPAQKKRP